MQGETHLRLPGDEVQVALLFGEEVVEREPRQYILQSVSHRPLDQLEAESFFLVCVLVGRHVNDTRGAKKLLAGQDHVEHVSGFEVGGDEGEGLVGHVAERGRGGPHLLGGRIHGDKGSGGVVASSEMCPFNFPSEESIQLSGRACDERRENVRKPTVEFHCPPRGPQPHTWEIAAPPAAPLEPPRGISTRPARSRRPPSWRCAHSPTFYPMSPPANFSPAGLISDGTLPSLPNPYLRRTWDARAAR